MVYMYMVYMVWWEFEHKMIDQRLCGCVWSKSMD